MSAPFLSVVIAAYNAENTIGAAIESVCRQRGATIELIIVDDGSSDGTLAIARRYATHRSEITILTQSNAGTAAAVNAGVAAARTEFIARLDADDELTDDYLTTMHSAIVANPDYDVYSHDLLVADAQGARKRMLGWTSARSVSLAELLRDPVIPGAGTIVRRSVFEDVGGNRRDVYNEDYDLWLRVFAKGARHLYVPAALYLYRRDIDTAKSRDLAMANRSTATILGDMVATNLLNEEEVAIAHAAIRKREGMVEELRTYGSTSGMIASQTLSRIEAAVSRVFGRRLGSGCTALLLRARPVVSPLWKPIARLILRSGHAVRKQD